MKKNVMIYFATIIALAMCLSGCEINKDKHTTVFNGDGKYTVVSTSIHATHPKDISVKVTSYQAFGYSNGVIFQFYSDNVVELIDFNTGDVIADLVTETEHGNSIGFFNEYFDKTDEFPMAIVSDGLSNKAYKIRIQRNKVTTIQKYVFPIDKCGYYVSTMLDSSNKILYTVGYTENKVHDNTSGNNEMIFSKWNLNKYVDNGDGTVTPEYISSFKTPFILTMQGSDYFNGKIYIVSSHWTDPDTKVYVIDPYKKAIINVMHEFPKVIKSIENEGIFFANIDNEYVALMKPNSDSPYQMLKFQ